jgi:hypothetical protein
MKQPFAFRTPLCVIRAFTRPAQPHAIVQQLQRVFSEFRRTHADRWAELQAAFTEEQLQSLRDMQSAPSYIA